MNIIQPPAETEAPKPLAVFKAKLLQALRRREDCNAAKWLERVRMRLARKARDKELRAAELLLAAEQGETLDVSTIAGPLAAKMMAWIIGTGRLKGALAVLDAFQQKREIPTLVPLHEALRLHPRLPVLLKGFLDQEDRTFQCVPGKNPGSHAMAVCFCGAGDRMGMPLNALHPWLQPQFAQIAYVRDKSRTLFLDGVEDLGSMEQSVAELRRIAEEAGCMRIVCIGSSAGSFGALVYAPKLGAQHVLCLSGVTDLDLLAEARGDDFRKFLAIQKQKYGFSIPDLRVLYAGNSAIRVRYIYPGENPVDAAQAEILENLPLVELHRLANSDEHNVLGTMLQRRLFRRELVLAATGKRLAQKAA
ncbi:hypothetical protein [Aestuariivirga sp.]|uniref:hypothetical protein n=1 Tax=Aestuariivirga sp. TaxID=2650926 RepID=UPI0039E6DA03